MLLERLSFLGGKKQDLHSEKSETQLPLHLNPLQCENVFINIQTKNILSEIYITLIHKMMLLFYQVFIFSDDLVLCLVEQQFISELYHNLRDTKPTTSTVQAL